MKKIIGFYQKNKNSILLVLGSLAVSLMVLPCLILGEASYVEIHDQLDGEVLNYIYRAKYLFRGNVIPEFMNGMNKAAMAPPAPFGVLFYAVLAPFAAYLAMWWMSLLTGFAGMYLLCCRMGIREEIGFLTALLFSYMPFYPVYALAALGQPLLVLCFLELLRGRRERKFWALAGICFYGGFSSLSLVGFVWVLAGLAAALLLYAGAHREFRCLRSMRSARRARCDESSLSDSLIQKDGAGAGRVLLGWGVLLATYLLTNLDLLGSVFGGSFETHRQEMKLTPTEHLGSRCLELFFAGGAYSKVYSAAIFAVAVVLLVYGRLAGVGKEKGIGQEKGIGNRAENRKGIGKEKGTGNREKNGNGIKTEIENRAEIEAEIQVMKLLAGLLILTAAGTVLAALWNSAAVVGIRKALGGVFVYFQADRIYWTFPFLWMLLLACEGQLLWLLAKRQKGKCLRGKRIAVLLLTAVLFLWEGAQILRDNTLNKNARLLLLRDYQQITWESIYMESVFKRIDEVIGADKKKVSVVSLGMYPSVALYNGYTCADGYSNNYSLAYKHKFREVMAEELEKNAKVKAYFDDWGNRLYLASSETGFDALVGKGQGFCYHDLQFNQTAMKELNIGYLFAAAPIENSGELGLELVAGSPFFDETGYYEVWVYRVEGSF